MSFLFILALIWAIRKTVKSAGKVYKDDWTGHRDRHASAVAAAHPDMGQRNQNRVAGFRALGSLAADSVNLLPAAGKAARRGWSEAWSAWGDTHDDHQRWLENYKREQENKQRAKRGLPPLPRTPETSHEPQVNGPMQTVEPGNLPIGFVPRNPGTTGNPPRTAPPVPPAGPQAPSPAPGPAPAGQGRPQAPGSGTGQAPDSPDGRTSPDSAQSAPGQQGQQPAPDSPGTAPQSGKTFTQVMPDGSAKPVTADEIPEGRYNAEIVEPDGTVSQVPVTSKDGLQQLTAAAEREGKTVRFSPAAPQENSPAAPSGFPQSHAGTGDSSPVQGAPGGTAPVNSPDDEAARQRAREARQRHGLPDGSQLPDNPEFTKALAAADAAYDAAEKAKGTPEHRNRLLDLELSEKALRDQYRQIPPEDRGEIPAKPAGEPDSSGLPDLTPARETRPGPDPQADSAPDSKADSRPDPKPGPDPAGTPTQGPTGTPTQGPTGTPTQAPAGDPTRTPAAAPASTSGPVNSGSPKTTAGNAGGPTGNHNGGTMPTGETTGYASTDQAFEGYENAAANSRAQADALRISAEEATASADSLAASIQAAGNSDPEVLGAIGEVTANQANVARLSQELAAAQENLSASATRARSVHKERHGAMHEATHSTPAPAETRYYENG